MAKTGRPTKYKSEYAEQARKYCLLNATDPNLAKMFDVSEFTISHWKRTRPDFSKAIKEGKAVADANIADSLAQRALGYSVEEEKIFCNSEGIVTRVKVMKHYPPDTAAAFIWLKNRAKWSDKKEQEPAVSPNITVVLGKSNDSPS